MRKKYLIDSNSLITPYERYYPFDIVVSFWTQLKHYIENGSIVVLDMVKSEIMKKSDDLSSWLDSINISEYVDHRNPEIIRLYQSVLENVKNDACYKDVALSDWSAIDSADPWLIATAAVNDYKIVSFETHNANLNPVNPSKRAKIPDIADQFTVEVIDLFTMMRELGFSF